MLTLVTTADGRASPVYGPDGRKLGTIAVRQTDALHWESWADGLPYIYERSTLSTDGRTWTSEGRMKNGRGQSYTGVDIWEKETETVTTRRDPGVP